MTLFFLLRKKPDWLNNPAVRWRPISSTSAPAIQLVKKGKGLSKLLLRLSALRLLVDICQKWLKVRVTLIPIHRRINYSGAADLLNVSRPYLVDF